MKIIYDPVFLFLHLTYISIYLWLLLWYDKPGNIYITQKEDDNLKQTKIIWRIKETKRKEQQQSQKKVADIQFGYLF